MLVGISRNLSRPATADEPASGTGLSRRITALIFAAISLALPLMGISGVGLMATVLCISVLYAVAAAPPAEPGSAARLSAVGMIPAGFIMAVFVATTIALVTSFSDSQFSQRYALVLWLIVVILPLSVAWHRSGSIRPLNQDVIATVIAALFGLMGVVAVVVKPLYTWAGAVGSGTDFNRHLIFVRQIVQEGGLDYSTRDYPRAFHSLVAVIWSASGGTSYADVYMAFEGVLWLALVLMLLAILITTIRVSRWLGFRALWVSWFVGGVSALIFVQSMWLTAIFRMGFVTSMGAGLVLMAITALSLDRDGGWFGSPNSIAALAIGVAVLANTWILLAPQLLVLACIAFGMAFRRERRKAIPNAQWWWAGFVVSVSIVLAVVPVASLVLIGRSADGEIGSDLGTTGFSGLLNPESVWYVALIGTALCLVWLWFRNFRVWVRFYGVIAITGMLMTGAVILLSAQPEGLSYYAAKILWTTLVFTIAPSAAILGCCLALAWQWARERSTSWPRLAATALVCAIVVLTGAVVLGRISGSPSKVVAGFQHGFGGLPVQLPVVTHLETLAIDPNDYQQVLVWGLVPESDIESMTAGSLGLYDHLARESTGWFGLTNFLADVPVFPVLIQRDSDRACDFLRQFPNALRITGPNPASGAAWLLETGCPESVVKSSEWVVVPLDDWGYIPTLGSDGRPNYQYPTLEEFLEAKDDQL